jgi:hypothetical protein
MKKQIKNMLFLIISLFMNGLTYAMENQGLPLKNHYEWFKGKDSTIAIRFKKEQLSYLPTIQWIVAGEEQTSEKNPIPLQQVSRKSLRTIKKIVEHVVMPLQNASEEDQVEQVVGYICNNNLTLTPDLKNAISYLDCAVLRKAFEMLGYIFEDPEVEMTDVFAQVLEESVEQKTQERENKKRKREEITVKTIDGEKFMLPKDVAKRAKTLADVSDVQTIDDEEQNELFTHAKAGIFAKFQELLELLNRNASKEKENEVFIIKQFLYGENYSLKKLCALAQEAHYQDAMEIFTAVLDCALEKLTKEYGENIDLRQLSLSPVVSDALEQKLRDTCVQLYRKKMIESRLTDGFKGIDIRGIRFINPNTVLLYGYYSISGKFFTFFATINLITRNCVTFDPIEAPYHLNFERDDIQVASDGKTVASIIRSPLLSKFLSCFVVHDVCTGKILFQKIFKKGTDFRYCDSSKSIFIFQHPEIIKLSLEDYALKVNSRLPRIALCDAKSWSGNGKIFAYLKKDVSDGPLLYVHHLESNYTKKIVINKVKFGDEIELKLSYDGTILISKDKRPSNEITCLNLQTEKVQTIVCEDETKAFIGKYAVSRDNKTLAVLFYSYPQAQTYEIHIALVDIQTRKCIKNFDISKVIFTCTSRGYMYPKDLCFTHDNKKIVVTYSNGGAYKKMSLDMLMVFDSQTSECLIKNFFY